MNIVTRRTWNVWFLAGRAARWVLAILVVLPAGAILAMFLFLVWLLWLASCGLQMLLMALTNVFDPPAHPLHRRPPPPGAVLSRGPGARMTLTLPPRKEVAEPQAVPRRHRSSVDELRHSLESMARYGWHKAEVLRALETAGAAWLWSEPLSPEAAKAVATSGTLVVAEAREHVHLRYRTGDTLWQRYMMPSAFIDVWFDQAGRLLHGRAWQQKLQM